MNDNLSLRAGLSASVALTPPSASELRRDIGLRYDGDIPPECYAAIAAAEQAEREARLTSGMTDAERLRFMAAKEFRLAKSCFRTLCRMMHQGYFTRDTSDPMSTFNVLQRRGRAEAAAHIEAWASVRHHERRAGQ